MKVIPGSFKSDWSSRGSPCPWLYCSSNVSTGLQGLRGKRKVWQILVGMQHIHNTSISAQECSSRLPDKDKQPKSCPYMRKNLHQSHKRGTCPLRQQDRGRTPGSVLLTGGEAFGKQSKWSQAMDRRKGKGSGRPRLWNRQACVGFIPTIYQLFGFKEFLNLFSLL